MDIQSRGDGNKKHERPDAVESDEDADTTRNNPQTSNPSVSGSADLAKKVACIRCRQSKLRCDSPRDPCSRCERLGLPCVTDKGYRRTNKRSKIDELEKAIQQLQARSLNPPPLDPPSLSQPPLNPNPLNPLIDRPLPWPAISLNQAPFPQSSPDTVTPNPGTTVQSSMTSPAQEQAVRDHSEPEALPHPFRPLVHRRSLGSFVLEPNEIQSLFNSYFDHFHPFFPVLDFTNASPDWYFDRSPLLFWSIICVAARRFSPDINLQSNLSRDILDLAWKVAADPPLTYPNVQGILLLCMWPLYITHLWSDVTVSLANIAVVACLHMGLHRPDHSGEFVRNRRTGRTDLITKEDKAERKRVWAGCNIISQYTIANVGYPPMGACFDWTVERACELGNAHTVPDDIRHHLIIQKFCAHATKVMSGNVADSLGLPSEEQYNIVMQLLEYELVKIEGQLAGKVSRIDQMFLLGARADLEVYHWLRPTWTEEKRQGVLKSYATATAIINAFLAADSAFQILLYCPIVFPRLLFNSAYIILRVLNSSLFSLVDIQAGASLFHSAISCMRRCSTLENDITARAAMIIMDVWQHRDEIFRNEKLSDPSLLSRSKNGGSMTFDCLWRWKDRFPDQRVTLVPPRPQPVQSWPEGQEQNQDLVPLPDPAGATKEDLEPVSLYLDWALMDDMSWPWDFDNPPAG